MYSESDQMLIRLCRLVCTFVVQMQHNQGFLRVEAQPYHSTNQESVNEHLFGTLST